MKKNTKGFTLIELLAVIVILAIIALIATPIVLNLINQARKGAAARSAEGIRKGAQTYYYSSLVEDPDADVSGTYTFTSTTGATNINASNNLFNIDGTMPSEGTVTIASDGKVTGLNIKIQNYYCRFDATGSATCQTTEYAS